MTSGESPDFKRLRKRSQAGQSLVILAIGFLALIAFVGIVTDVSLLFVRFSTLRRAVDAAAVAAAGQMRRVEDPSPSNLLAEDQATSYANMNLAARQFIEFYGLDPTTVLVETCHVQNTLPAGRDPQLCTADERKLVRVTAQIEAPTTFFSLFGFGTIRLEAASISETAVLDLIFIMDVSESMLNETTYVDWEQAGYGQRYLPPVFPPLTAPTPSDTLNRQAQDWATLLGLTNNQIFADLNGPNDIYFQNILPNPNHRQLRVSGSGNPTRVECQARFWPGSVLKGGLTNPDVINQYINDLGGFNNFVSWFKLDHSGTAPSLAQVLQSGVNWRGFVPQYDFYGCCNDPNGDGDMSDLICQPFGRARASSIDFMTRLDFIRGDRVAIVTFDRRAYLMDPDPSDIDAVSGNPAISDTRDAMIASENLARVIMEERVGVRTEPSFYADSWTQVNATTTTRDGRWDTFVDNGVGRDWNYFNANTPVGRIVDHPVKDNCYMDAALLGYPYGLYRNPTNTDYRYGFAGLPLVLLDEIDTLPAWYTQANMGGTAGNTWLRRPAAADTAFYDRLRRSYEYNASCAGTNIGEGLGRASEVLGRLGRREGAVWIMVLLSDGAAGATSPAWRNGNLAQTPLPYQPGPVPGGTSPVGRSFIEGYGAYGLCPYGEDPSTGTSPEHSGGRSLRPYNANSRPYANEILMDLDFPFCGDFQPYTRHFCNDRVQPATPDLVGPNRVELSDEPSCDTYYDPDDFARDWADYISVRGINVYQRTVTNIDTTVNDTDTLLPTIFTIAFGLEFDNTTCSNNLFGNPLYDCNVPSYLGEELLRYIADAGDNFRIDSDYWQEVMDYRIPNRASRNMPVGLTADWGPRGPCETPAGTRGAWSPLAPTQNCGNYWAASTTGGELDQVFAEIAARMFTRLSG
jgi:Flp pilus assembly protein TadG